MSFVRKILRASACAAIAFAAASFSQVQAQVIIQQGTGQPTMAPGRVNQTPWFTNPQIRQHLNINDNQFGALDKAYQNAWMNYQKGVVSIDKQLPEPQRQQQILEMQQRFYRDYSGSAEKYLKDPTQRQRHDQLYRQYQGYGAFADPAVADQLKLTPAQREKMQQYQQEWSTQMGKLDSMYQTDRQQAIGLYTQMQTQNGNRINSVLTPQQQTTWQQLVGQQYNFGPDVYLGTNARPLSGGKK